MADLTPWHVSSRSGAIRFLTLPYNARCGLLLQTMRTAWSVCRSVSLLITNLSAANIARTIEMPFREGTTCMAIKTMLQLVRLET